MDEGRLAELSEWWWGLTDKQRDEFRRAFLERCKTDLEFRKQVLTLLREEDVRESTHNQSS
jgi:hypothetical protein